MPGPNTHYVRRRTTLSETASASPPSLSPVLVFGFLNAFDHGRDARRLLERASALPHSSNSHQHKATGLWNRIKRDDDVAAGLQAKALQPGHLPLESLRLGDARILDEDCHDVMPGCQLDDDDLLQMDLNCLGFGCRDHDFENDQAELKRYSNTLQRFSPPRFQRPMPSLSEIAPYSNEIHTRSSISSASEASEPNTPSIESFNTVHGTTFVSGVESWLSRRDGPWAKSVDKAPNFDSE